MRSGRTPWCRLVLVERKDEIDSRGPSPGGTGPTPVRRRRGVPARACLPASPSTVRCATCWQARRSSISIRYLVLAHHGKLRVQVRDPGDLAVLAPGEASEHKLLGLQEGATVHIPPLLGLPGD